MAVMRVLQGTLESGVMSNGLGHLLGHVALYQAALSLSLLQVGCAATVLISDEAGLSRAKVALVRGAQQDLNFMAPGRCFCLLLHFRSLEALDKYDQAALAAICTCTPCSVKQSLTAFYSFTSYKSYLTDN